MKRLCLAALCVLCLAAWAPPPAGAAFGISEFDVAFENEDGSPATQAGSHPFAMTTRVEMNTVSSPIFGGAEVPEDALKDLITELPVGMAGDPFAVPRCTAQQFSETSPATELPLCPNETAVGTVAVAATQSPPRQYTAEPVYNLEPPPGYAAALGFVVHQVPITILVGVREDAPNEVFAEIRNASQVLFIYGAELTIWGDPSDPAHDPFRGTCVENQISSPTPTIPSNGGDCSVLDTDRAFLTLPASCEAPLQTSYEASSWQEPAVAVKGSATSPAPTECEALGPFAPEVATSLSTEQATSAAGMEFSIDIDDPGLTDPDGTATSTIRKAVVTLPEGVTVNPSQAAGLGTCSQAQLAAEHADSEPGQGCPQDSKIGSIEVTTPILEGHNLQGSLYIATPYENPFASLIALYMVFRDPDLGVAIRQAGEVVPDPKTGQLTATFEEIPQLPFSHLRVNFRAGARSPLVTPPACGTYTTKALLTPSGDPGSPVLEEASFAITSGPGGGPCPSSPGPFDPKFSAGTENNKAGSFSPLLMRIQRSDSEQELTRLSSVLPDGLTAKIAGVGRCPDAAIAAAAARKGIEELAAPSCPAASRLGSVTGGAGVGTELTYVSGSLFLAGPYKGAPLSIAAIVPAVAGPFDVGTVVTRVGVNLNPVTAQAVIDGSASDPIPHILAGIPLRLRDLRIDVDRPNFSLNPTGCAPKTIAATLFGAAADPFSTGDDSSAAESAAYQASECKALRFAPKLSLRLKGATKRTGHPALQSTLVPRPGDANLGRAVVLLPGSMFIDQNHINNPCTRVQFNADQCPPASVLGTVRATTPLLDEALEGPVYFRSNGGDRELPDIVADLRGLFHVTLVGFVDSKNERLRTTFATPPDVPVTKFTLKLRGGKRGLLVNSENLCRAPQRSKLALTAANGRKLVTTPAIRTDCGKGSKKKKGGRGR